jgi:hypothetical protein
VQNHLSTRPLTRLAGILAITTLGFTACGDDGGSSASGASDQTQPPSSESTAPATDEPVIDPGDGGDYHPEIDPANFVDVVDNPYFPLPSGATWHYTEIDEGVTEEVDVVVTDQRREVMGVSTTVVRDTVSVDGVPVEDTRDWYAQDQDGNVWYFGEDVDNYENGELVDHEGSFEAGVDGAFPGIVMEADPQVGDAYRQEFYEGTAEDLGEVLEVDQTFSTPAGDFDQVIVTRDWNPLEPDIIEQKYYAPGIGVVGESTVAGGSGDGQLIESSLLG